MEKKEEKGKQPLMSGVSVLTAIESVLAFALICVSVWSLYTIVAYGAIHQLIIAIPSLIVAVAIICQQERERENETDA
jgi:hypothetical protein